LVGRREVLPLREVRLVPVAERRHPPRDRVVEVVARFPTTVKIKWVAGVLLALLGVVETLRLGEGVEELRL
jgi:transposase